MSEVSYESRDEDFYDKQTKSINPLRAWFHTNRYAIIRSLVDRHYSQGDIIVDLGCGSCVWNTGRLPVIGVDVNESMLEFARESGRLIEYRLSPVEAMDFSDNYADIIVISEVLEHITDYESVIEEIHRVLKPNGILILSVPHDTVTSLWKPLFFIQCILQGYIFGDAYYKNNCGHVNHFSPYLIRNTVRAKGFGSIEQFDMNRFTLFLTALKAPFNEDFHDVTLIIPTLDEGENIHKLMAAIEESYPEINVIVTDDGSKDGTQEIVLQRQLSNPRIKLLDRSGRSPGLTSSVIDALSMVETEYIVVMDADLQHPPEKIREVVNLLKSGDSLVVGTRTAVENWGLIRHAISIVATQLGRASLFLRRSARCRDLMSGFFGANTSLLGMYAHDTPSAFQGGGYKVLFDLLKRLPSDTVIGEVPYVFQNRSGGESKINKRHAFIYSIQLFTK